MTAQEALELFHPGMLLQRIVLQHYMSAPSTRVIRGDESYRFLIATKIHELKLQDVLDHRDGSSELRTTIEEACVGLLLIPGKAPGWHALHDFRGEPNFHIAHPRQTTSVWRK